MGNTHQKPAEDSSQKPAEETSQKPTEETRTEETNQKVASGTQKGPLDVFARVFARSPRPNGAILTFQWMNNTTSHSVAGLPKDVWGYFVQFLDGDSLVLFMKVHPLFYGLCLERLKGIVPKFVAEASIAGFKFDSSHRKILSFSGELSNTNASYFKNSTACVSGFGKVVHFHCINNCLYFNIGLAQAPPINKCGLNSFIFQVFNDGDIWEHRIGRRNILRDAARWKPGDVISLRVGILEPNEMLDYTNFIEVNFSEIVSESTEKEGFACKPLITLTKKDHKAGYRAYCIVYKNYEMIQDPFRISGWGSLFPTVCLCSKIDEIELIPGKALPAPKIRSK